MRRLPRRCLLLDDAVVDRYVGQRLRRRREELSLPLERVARATRISVDRLHRIEQGLAPASPRQLPLICGILGIGLAYPFESEACTITIGHTLDLGNLAFVVMRQQRLVEKHARAAGLDRVTASYVVADYGISHCEGLVSGKVHFASAGVTSLLRCWDDTRDNCRVKALRACSTAPFSMITTSKRIRALGDFRENDRINVRQPKLALSAIMLQMAAAQTFGFKQFAKFDTQTVGITAAIAAEMLLSGGDKLTADFSYPPFCYWEQDHPDAHKILRSEEVMGGLMTHNLLGASSTVYEQSPGVVAAVVAAFDEANDAIGDRQIANQAFASLLGGPSPDAARITDDPEVSYGRTPFGVEKFADFMFKTGALAQRPALSPDIFFAREAMQLGIH